MVAHWYTYALSRCRTSQYRMTFVPLSVSSGMIVLTPCSMVWDWRVSRACQCFFIGLSCSIPTIVFYYFSLSLLLVYRLVLWDWGLRTDRVYIYHSLSALHCRPLLIIIIIIIIITLHINWILLVPLDIYIYIKHNIMKYYTILNIFHMLSFAAAVQIILTINRQQIKLMRPWQLWPKVDLDGKLNSDCFNYMDFFLIFTHFKFIEPPYNTPMYRTADCVPMHTDRWWTIQRASAQ